MAMRAPSALIVLLLVGAFSSVIPYTRPPPRDTLFIGRADYESPTTPEQVHVSVVGQNQMRISWVTDDPASATVDYGTSSGTYTSSAMANTTSYSYESYQSGQIYDAVIGPLQPSTVYYYRCSGDSSREFNFTTPPAQFPVRLVIVGDLGQTGWTQTTLQHIAASNYDMLLLPGDLSYADYDEPRWDSYGRLVEPLASQRPWMMTAGNHDAVIGPLQPSTVYYYRCSGDSSLEFNFTTPPAQFPVSLVIIGDLGQTGWTQTTLQHIAASNYDMLLLPGDLSYADYDEPRWDSYGRLVEPLASQRPWMMTAGNHDVEKKVPPTPFTAYNARWRMPFEQSGSDSNLFYSFNVAGVHVIMLCSYTAFDEGSDQYAWLQNDLQSVNRAATPWVFVLLHAPWYNSNYAHQGEEASVGMKQAMEGLVYQYSVDVVFAGHVHAYERFTRVYNGEADNCGPVYITIGDGGNREGLATDYMDPQPEISLFREASFGHGELDIFNGTTAFWTWHRNDDDESVVADSVWLTTLASNPNCSSS